MRIYVNFYESIRVVRLLSGSTAVCGIASSRVCGSAHGSVCAVGAAVCGTALGSVGQCAQQCVAVWQCAVVRQCVAVRAAIYGSAALSYRTSQISEAREGGCFAVYASYNTVYIIPLITNQRDVASRGILFLHSVLGDVTK
jgi:hypothetical protein